VCRVTKALDFSPKEETMKARVLGVALLPLAIAAGPTDAGEPNDLFWVRASQKSPEQVVAAIKGYAETRKWLYLADFKIKGGQVTSVKVCYPPIGKDIFAAGMHVAAMMPCGHIAVYDDGGTKLSMLHPKFMTALYPDENLERAVREVTPLFEAMLIEVVR
jgi:hypothetical protein